MAERRQAWLTKVPVSKIKALFQDVAERQGREAGRLNAAIQQRDQIDAGVEQFANNDPERFLHSLAELVPALRPYIAQPPQGFQPAPDAHQPAQTIP